MSTITLLNYSNTLQRENQKDISELYSKENTDKEDAKLVDNMLDEIINGKFKGVIIPESMPKLTEVTHVSPIQQGGNKIEITNNMVYSN